jgi:hypothetical protein
MADITQESIPTHDIDTFLVEITASIEDLNSHLDSLLVLYQGRVDYSTPTTGMAVTPTCINSHQVDPGLRAFTPVVNRLPDDDPPRASVPAR